MWELSGSWGWPHGMLSVLLGAWQRSPAVGGAGGRGAGWAVLSILWDPPPADLAGTERQAGRQGE